MIRVLLVILLLTISCGGTKVHDRRKHEFTCNVPAPQVITKEVVVEKEVVKQVEVPKVITKEKVKRVTLPITYYSMQCGRHIIKHGQALYVMSTGLARLTSSWYTVSGSCKLRYRQNKLEVK